MKIIPTHPGDRTFQFFEAIPALLYNETARAARIEEHPDEQLLHQCFVAEGNGCPIGRIAVFRNPGLTYQGQAAAAAGLYECANNKTAAKLLLDAAAKSAAEFGVTWLIGPMNGSTWNSYRFRTDDNRPPFLLEPIHHTYYNDHFSENGFHPVAHYVSSLQENMAYGDDATRRAAARLASAGVHVRRIDLRNYEKELDLLYPLLSSAFSRNFLYTPVNRETFVRKYLAAAAIINGEHTFLAEDGKTGQPVGLIFCYDDKLSTPGKRIVVKTVARHPSFRYAGAGNVLSDAVVESAVQNGYTSVIHALMHRDNISVNLSKTFNGTRYRDYNLYARRL